MRDYNKEKRIKITQRHKRVRVKIHGTKEIPRLSVYRSLSHIYAQLIDDDKGVTLVGASDLELKKAIKHKVKKAELAKEVGKLIAEKAKKAKIERVVFDRGGFQYHGRVKGLAEAARQGGLKF